MQFEATESPIENTMRAVAIDGPSGRKWLAAVEVPRPDPGPEEVPIRVAGAGVNPIDWRIREGQAGSAPATFPLVLGWDVSGTVFEAGPGVTSLVPGDEAYGLTEETGAYAEYAGAPAVNLATRPSSTDLVRAAAPYPAARAGP